MKWSSSAGFLLAALVLVARPAIAAPVDGELGFSVNGGGCYPTGISPGLFDYLSLLDPEWTPVVPSDSFVSAPVTVHATVETFHGDTGGDFPATHVTSDAVFEVEVDPADVDLAGTYNDAGHMGIEWEHGSLPAFAWPGEGDRIVALGRWIFDCGHATSTPGNCSTTVAHQCILDTDCPMGETCVGEHVGYESEMHPPQALATIRAGGGGLISTKDGAAPVLATRADIFVSGNGGGAGDRCIVTHRPSPLELLSVSCFPLSKPVAALNSQDFTFDLPLPPQPVGARRVRHLLVKYPNADGTKSPKVKVRPFLTDPIPHLQVTVRMTAGSAPTGFSGTLFAGWVGDATPLSHVRVTLQQVEVKHPLKPAVPISPKTCSSTGASCTADSDCTDPSYPVCTFLSGTSKVCQRACGADTDCKPPTCPACSSSDTCLGLGPITPWALQVGVNGQWQKLTGLDSVTQPTIAGGSFSIPQAQVYDQFLPSDGSLRIQAHGVSKECVDAMLGKAIATDLVEQGLTKGLDCLTSRGHTSFGGSQSHSPGRIDQTYAGPNFGAGMAGTDYVVPSVGGDAGHCSVSTSTLCVFDEDCPGGETCTIVGAAFDLHYHIEVVP
ncbi:MAG TPA: hypothetical protein VGK20_07435 [Candidatus Binatia bacterium]|jgi:hypothetical protein